MFMNNGFLVASLLSLTTWAIHTVVGGPAVARPLVESELRPVVKWTNYYAWHLVTLVLAAQAGAFLYAAWVPEGRDVAWLATLLSATFMGWSVALVLWRYRRPWQLPQWMFFLSITLAAGWGLVG